MTARDEFLRTWSPVPQEVSPNHVVNQVFAKSVDDLIAASPVKQRNVCADACYAKHPGREEAINRAVHAVDYAEQVRSAPLAGAS
jgi:hypothetical protein